MEYGINITYLTKKISIERSAQVLSSCGFRLLDYSTSYSSQDFEKHVANDMSVFDKYGLCVHQTHAPFNRYGTYGDKHGEYVYRCLQATHVLGAKYMVVHGDEFDFDKYEFTPEKALQYNYEYFAPFVDKASKFGIKIAFETVFEDGFDSKRRFCSQSDELMALIKRFNTDSVCCCWDFGHAGLAFKQDHAQRILEFGKYIECTHVQDCGHGHDMHLPPYQGDIDWQECMIALRSAGYRGNLMYEMVYGTVYDDMAEPFCAYLSAIARSLNGLFESEQLGDSK